MRIGRKPGMVRRPIEYVLPAILVVLISALLLSVWALNDNNNIEVGNEKGIEAISGSLDEIDELAEEDIENEISIDRRYDESEEAAAEADKAAAEIGGIYDEEDY